MRLRIARLCARPYSSRPAFTPGHAFKFTQPPNPNWKPGLSGDTPEAKQWKADEEQGWRSWDLGNLASRDVYPLLTSAAVPRPIAFVSTVSSDGVPNLAPMSYFSLVSHDPPLPSVSLSLSPSRPKDTRENIRSTKEFTVSIISEAFVEAANACAVEAPDYVDEWIVSGLTPDPSTHVKPARVRESAASFECELFHFQDIKRPDTDMITHSLVLGLIKSVHIRNSVLTEAGTVDPHKIRAVSRLGGQIYARIGEGFELSRPLWKQLRPEYEELVRKHRDQSGVPPQ